MVCSAHLEDFAGGIAGRFRQYRCIVNEISRRDGDSAAAIIAGDFNTFDCPSARLLRGGGGIAQAVGKPFLCSEAAWWKTQLLPETGYGDPFTLHDWTFQFTPLFRPKLDWTTVKGLRDPGPRWAPCSLPTIARSVSIWIGQLNAADCPARRLPVV